MKNNQLFLRGFALVLVIFLVQAAVARPNSRMKRVSDQRLAELETQRGIEKMKGQLVTIPIAFGKLNPLIVGRKRRSESRLLDMLLNRSSEEDVGDPLDLNYDDLYRQKR